MDKHRVVPDVVDVIPPQVLQVEYDSGVIADLGNELTPTQVKDLPGVKWETNKGSFYTLCMTDPDAGFFKQVKHWLVVNIPGNNVEQGETLTEYIGSGPRQGTGIHRYVFLVFKQPCKLKYEETRATNRSAQGRPYFSIKKFAWKYKLGQPIAGNFFRAQWDEYVPTLHKQVQGWVPTICKGFFFR